MKFFRRKKEKAVDKDEEEIDQLMESIKKPEKQPLAYPVKSIEKLEAKTENLPIIKILKTCFDPEINVDIWSLELIYNISVNNKKVDIVMTFTTPLCPYGPQIVEDMQNKLEKDGYKTSVEVVFYPLWKPSDRIREMLGISKQD